MHFHLNGLIKLLFFSPGSASEGVLKLCEHLGYKPDEYKLGRYAI